MKFTPPGGRVELEATALGTGCVRIEIRDTGPGMTQSRKSKLPCAPSARWMRGFNKRHEGTGLGLPISLALARLHGGDMTIDSDKGRGHAGHHRPPGLGLVHAPAALEHETGRRSDEATRDEAADAMLRREDPPRPVRPRSAASLR